MGICNVERSIRKREGVDVPCLKADIGELSPSGERSGALELDLGDVDSDHLTGRNDLRDITGDRPRAGTTIEHGQA
jgi:hypothetical protein